MHLTSIILLNILGLVIAKDTDWHGWGGNTHNNRWATQTSITPSNIKTLTRKCPGLTYPFGISATPTVVDKTVYFPTWNGSLVSLDYTTWKIHWSLNVTQLIIDYGPPEHPHNFLTYPVSRTSVQVSDNVLFFGTQRHSLLFAANRFTGKILSHLRLNTHPLAVITVSPTFHKNTLFLGTSSIEEPVPIVIAGYKCCNYTGNAAAVSWSPSSQKLSLKWSLDTVPPASTGWSGAGVWGSQPAVDSARNQVFFATGNGVNQEAVIAVDIPTGRINWVKRLAKMDAWNGACFTDPIDITNCPSEPPGRDHDFGMAPTFVPAKVSGLKEDVVVVGHKNTIVYALSAKDGRLIYARNISPDGRGGGLSWVVAVDEKRVYYTLPYSVQGPLNVSTTVFWAADLKTGKSVWRVPAGEEGSQAYGITPPSVAGELVFFPKVGNILRGITSYLDTKGALVVVDRKSGRKMKEVELDANFHGGIAVSGRHLFFRTGYRMGVLYTGNGSLWILEAGKLEPHGGW
ncbi:Polyvinylalcohol dehydrogenase [Podospora australis]|uniref:Polyvinylalcohol dehydrogenase n=1 Tax=Podospora australis TaxID=1536484 RepID=A0AAN6WKW2_9PEZI|nr:Polyvinylalcohol dehydrogenase [Podospora australis]